MNKKLPLGLLAAALMVLPACSGGDAPVETVTETTTVESPDKPNPTRGGSPAYEPYTPPAQNTPSPWVQGQIDWSNCLESGKSEEQCRAELN